MPIPFIRNGLKRPRYLWVPAVIVSAIAIASVGLAHFTAQRLTQQRIATVVDNASVLADQLADALTTEIDQNLGYLHGVPVMLSRLPLLQEPMRHLPPLVNGSRDSLPLMRRATLLDTPGLPALNRVLDSSAQDLGISLILVLNKAGICVASSNYLWPDTVVGTDLSDRQYFYGALSGQPAIEYAVGRRTGEPGMFFSAPIVDQGKITGVVAVKIDIAAMRNWIGGNEAFVTDRNGVIVIAHDPHLLFKAMRGASVFSMSPKEQFRLYRRDRFDVVQIDPLDVPSSHVVDLMEDSVVPVVIRSRQTRESGLTVYAVNPVSEIPHIATERQRYFWLACLTYLGFGIAATALIAYYLQDRRYVKATIALNVTLRQVNLDLEYQVQHDALTGVFNRRHFVKVLADQIQADPAQAGFSVAVIDLDFFKRINDGYGHAAGDEALKAFATLCQHALREDDVLGRIGGEEFAIVLPGLDENGACRVLEAMRQQVASTPILFRGHAIQLTVSVGVAGFRTGDNVDGLLYRADNALYHAKASGRNRVVRYQDLVPPDGAILSSS